MSQQSEIFARYRSLFNSNSVHASESEFSRKLDNLDFVDFLFELVKATKGQSQFKNIILKGSLSQLRKSDELNNTIKTSLFSKFGCDSALLIQTQHTTKSSLGIELSVAEVDHFGLLGIDPNTSPGRYLYEGNDVSKHINYLFYKAQGVTPDAPLSFTYSNRVLFTIASSSPNTFNFKFGDYYENKHFGVWLTDYLAVCNPIFNTVNFTTILTDLITGSISIKAKKNKLEIEQQSATIKALQKLFGFCSEADIAAGNANSSANVILNQQMLNANFNGENFTSTQTGLGQSNTGDINPFDFSQKDLTDIEQDADLRSRGVVNFVTCGNLELNISPDDIISGLDNLFGNGSTNDIPYSYDGMSEPQLSTASNGNSPTSTSYDNTKIDPNPQNAANFFDNAIKNGAINAINAGETSLTLDLPNINAELQLNILKAIPYALMQMVLTPKILLIPKLHSVLSGDDSSKSISDFVTMMSGVIKEIGSSITSLLIKNIFDSIKSDLVKLAKTLATQFLKQRGVDYAATLTSLLSLLGLFSGGGSGCGGVLDKLLKLLKLANFGPMPMLPSPLILVGGALKPGMNSIAMINDIKANLTQKGIETAPTLPDGTPNNMMIAIEEAVKVITTHIKTNSTIQTFGIGPTGPVQGYGQIQ